MFHTEMCLSSIFDLGLNSHPGKFRNLPLHYRKSLHRKRFHFLMLLEKHKGRLLDYKYKKKGMQDNLPCNLQLEFLRCNTLFFLDYNFHIRFHQRKLVDKNRNLKSMKSNFQMNYKCHHRKSLLIIRMYLQEA